MALPQLIDPERSSAPTRIPPQGPSAHEDLTIAEHLSNMLAGDEHRPNEQGCVDEHGKVAWLSENRIEQFVREFGALHPSDYQNRHGRPWQADFFACESTSQSIPS